MGVMQALQNRSSSLLGCSGQRGRGAKVEDDEETDDGPEDAPGNAFSDMLTACCGAHSLKTERVRACQSNDHQFETDSASR